MIKDRLTRGAAWLTATRAFVNIVGFASTIMLACLLLPADFGLVAIAATIAAVVGSVTEMSLSSALVHLDDPQEQHFDAAWTLNVVRAALLAGLMAAMAYPVSHIYGDPRLLPIMFALAAITLLGGFNNPKLVVFTRNLVFRQEFVIGVSQKLLGFIVALAIAVLYRSYWALIAGGAAAQVLAIILSYLLLPYRPRFRLAGSRSLLEFSIWLTFGRIANTLTWRSDQLFIGYFLGNGPLGIYTFGDNIAGLPTREATGPISQTLFPAFSRLTADRDRLRSAYLRAQTLICAIALPIGCGLALVARPLILTTVGPKWEPAIVVIEILASIFAIQIVSSTLQPLAMAMGETRALFRRDFANMLFRFPCVTLGLVAGGLIGAVVARFVSDMVTIYLNLALVRRLIGISVTEQIVANGRSALAVGVMAVAVGTLQHFTNGTHAPALVSLAEQTLAGALCYTLALAGIWIAEGRPEGPELSMLEIARRAGTALRLRIATLAVLSR